MVRTRAMAALAALLGGAAFLIQCGFPVRRFLPAFVDFLMTSLAGLSSYVLRDFRGRHTGRSRSGGWSTLLGSLGGSLAKSKSDGHEGEQDQEKQSSSALGISWHHG